MDDTRFTHKIMMSTKINRLARYEVGLYSSMKIMSLLDPHACNILPPDKTPLTILNSVHFIFVCSILRLQGPHKEHATPIAIST